MEDYSKFSKEELIEKCANLYIRLNNRNKYYQEINRPKLLLVEGPDDKYFLMEVIKNLGIEDIQIEKIDGKTNLESFLKTIRIVTGYKNVLSIGIILDADSDIYATFESVKSTLSKLRYPIPEELNSPKAEDIKMTIYIMPDCVGNGELETLLLQSIKDNSVIPCIDSFQNCLRDKQLDFNITTKSIIYSYLAIQKVPGLRIGDASKCGYFGLDNPIFEPLKKFLFSL